MVTGAPTISNCCVGPTRRALRDDETVNLQEPAPAPGEDHSLALALVNTRVSGSRGVFDRLNDVPAVDMWLARHELTSAKHATARDAAQLIALRTDAREVLEATEHHAPASDAVLSRVNTAASTPVHPRLSRDQEGLRLDWQPSSSEPVTSLIARDLLLVATSPLAGRIRTCAADDCDRMFIQDHGRRLWCSPGCGNRMRVRRHSARQQRAPRAAS